MYVEPYKSARKHQPKSSNCGDFTRFYERALEMSEHSRPWSRAQIIFYVCSDKLGILRSRAECRVSDDI